MPRKRSRSSSKRRTNLRTSQWYRGCDQRAPGKPKPSPIDPYYRTKTWRILRKAILERDQHVCMYCGNKAIQVDHIVPRRQGGEDAHHNLVACCVSCNRRAGARIFKSFEVKKWWLLAGKRGPVPHPWVEE